MAGDDDGLSNYFTQSANQDQANGQPANQQPPQHSNDQEEQQYLGLNHQDQGKIIKLKTLPELAS